jgi:hypothetical protein
LPYVQDAAAEIECAVHQLLATTCSN